jgi:hypothetical protein
MVGPIDSVGPAEILPRLRRLRIQHLRFLALLEQLGSLLSSTAAPDSVMVGMSGRASLRDRRQHPGP